MKLRMILVTIISIILMMPIIIFKVEGQIKKGQTSKGQGNNGIGVKEKTPSTVKSEEKYWDAVDKANIGELKIYLTKYPKGIYSHLANTKIKKLKALAKQVETANNINCSNVGSNKTENTNPDSAIDKRMTGEFVKIPVGTFMMGESRRIEVGKNFYNDDEKPVHKVVISQAFEIGKYEVTQEQWEAVMGNNPSYFKGDGRLPVEGVSWNDVQQFISVLNSKSRKYTYRLPTEEEWEYAARAGSTGDYAGDLDRMGWYVNNSGDVELNMTATDYDHSRVRSNNVRTHPVGEKEPNAWGIYDMHGNVNEWCEDRYGNYSSGPVMDTGVVVLSTTKKRIVKEYSDDHVLRGGSFFETAEQCRSACRFGFASDGIISSFGIRLLRTRR